MTDEAAFEARLRDEIEVIPRNSRTYLLAKSFWLAACAHARRDERQQCMKLICWYCNNGAPLDEWGNHQHVMANVQRSFPCEAAAIRSLP